MSVCRRRTLLTLAALLASLAVSASSSAQSRSTPPRPAPRPVVLFDDEFSGHALNARRWTIKQGCENFTYACPRSENVSLDGRGHLVLDLKRAPANTEDSNPFSGAWIETFDYGSGWPPFGIKKSFKPPFRVVMRAKQPPTAGAWTALWLMNTDRPDQRPNNELDVAEERLSFPTDAGMHQHLWLNGADRHSWDGHRTVSDMTIHWHLFAADVYTTHVSYFVDNVSVGTASGVSGAFGLMLDATLGAPGSWGAGRGQPAATDPGPWPMLVDYVRVVSLRRPSRMAGKAR